MYHFTTVSNDMFDHLDGVMWAVANKRTQWNEDQYFAVKFACQKLSKYYTEVTGTTGMCYRVGIISNKHFCPGGMAASEWMHSVRAVRDTPVVDYSAPGSTTMRGVAYRPPITILLFLLTLLVSYFKQTLWRCGQL